MLNTNKVIPTLVVDDFFDNPDGVRALALQQQYTKDPNNHWPGKRSPMLHEIDHGFFVYTINKVLSLFYYTGADVKSPEMEINWQAFANFQLVDSSYGSGWIHRDNTLITGIIYLNKEYNPNSGTSIFLQKEGWGSINYKEKEKFLNGEMTYQEVEKFRLENHAQYEEVINIKNRYNRLVIFDSNMHHAANDFITANNNEERLTLVFFINRLDVLKTPIQRMNTTL